MIPKNVQMPNPNPKYKPPGTPAGGRGGNMNQCKNLEACIQSITWAWLASYGGREMQTPNCKTCNAYHPVGEEETP